MAAKSEKIFLWFIDYSIFISYKGREVGVYMRAVDGVGMKGAEVVAHRMSLQGTNRFDGIDGNFFSGRQGGFFGCLVGGFEFAVDGDEGILVETRVAFEAGFGVLVETEDVEIVLEKAQTVLESGHRVVVLKRVSLALREFDEGTIILAGLRPRLGEMVRIKLEETVMFRRMADDDMFAVTASFFGGVHGTPESFITFNGLKIAYTSCGNDRTGGGRRKIRNEAFQTGNYACF